MFNRSRRNIACWFALSMGGILIFFAGVVYYREVQDQLDTFDQDLYRKGKLMAAKAEYRFEQGQWWLNLEDVPLLESERIPFYSELAYTRWYNIKGNLVQSIGDPAPEKLTVASGFHTIKTNNNQIRAIFSGTSLRQLTLPVVQDNFLVGYLQVATPLTPLLEQLAQTRLFLTLGVPVTLGLIGFTGWFLGGIAMKPIRLAYEQLQRFTADSSHELRAPLSAILSNAQVGLLSPAGDDAAKRQRLENIVEITKSMSVLISNLLFLARHAGKLAPEALKRTDLVSLLQLLDDYAALADAKSLNFITHLPEQPVKLNADPDLLQQAVRNLLNNAFKYTPSGGKVELRLFTQSNRVMIQVEDNGIGIPAADLPHIFERFYRVDTVRSRQTGGFGLGLSIAQQIIAAHGGQITVKSVVGQGATFQIELPLR